MPRLDSDAYAILIFLILDPTFIISSSNMVYHSLEQDGLFRDESGGEEREAAASSSRYFFFLPLVGTMSRPPRCPQQHKTLLLVVILLSQVLLVTAALATDRRFSLFRRRPKPKLFFNSTTRTFRILQITDIHLGENAWTDWGPEQDRKTFVVLDAVLQTEGDFDLIVVSGDFLTANNIDKNATAYLALLQQHLEPLATPWALVFGNHDDADLEQDGQDGQIIYTKARTSRKQLARYDSRHSLSLTQMGPSDLPGVSNYWLDIYENDDDAETIAARVLILDSGGGPIPQQILTSQVDWFLETNMNDVPVVAFEHIPATQFAYSDDTCSGMQRDGVAAMAFDAGIVTALDDESNVLFLAVGHNHGNDYCCAYSSISLCFGRHSGYGGYGGDWKRGVRVYELSLNDNGSVDWSSYVRLEDGSIANAFDPTTAD